MLGNQKGTLLAVQQIDIHGSRFWDVSYALLNTPDQARQGRIGLESVYDNPRIGDKVILHQVLGVLTKIELCDE